MRHAILSNIEKKLYKAGLLPLKSQAALSTQILRDRLESVLPEAMEKSGLDFWLIAAKEYNEDPIMKTLFTWDMPNSRRLSALAFHYDRSSGSVRRMSIGALSPEMANIYDNVKHKDESPWECITRVISQYNPNKIAINKSNYHGYCDGLSASIYDSLIGCLKPEYQERLCSADEVAIRWLQKVTARELELMGVLVDVTQDIVKLSFSKDLIKPGITNTSEVEWAMRDIITQLGFDYWFGPDVDLQRKGCSDTRLADSLIQAGDLLHCDIGITGKYIRLHTDIQWLAYIRKPNEASVPKGLLELFASCNRFQDIVASNFKAQLTGNELFVNAITQAKDEGLTPMLYSHPLGAFGHGAGPTIGLYDVQGYVKGGGEYPIEDRTCYALELNICGSLPEWDNQEVFIYREEDIYFDKEVLFIHGRQTKLIEI